MEMIKNLALAVDATKKVDDWMVVAMGVGVVFVGLVLIILICKIMSLEIIAAVTAACAEEMGKDISALRVISFKKL